MGNILERGCNYYSYVVRYKYHKKRGLHHDLTILSKAIFRKLLLLKLYLMKGVKNVVRQVQ